ncbi:putative nADH dehydrogenase [Mycobacterium xenopi 4042]|uniref:Putative nADH dehydrogenase n=1 Tax=Mycobacterium xenopi 4042 TaxID=1299334 RepID=X8E745_MYCXE|nr:putative nADH dehydrogenase [Mycobacterium xenopi 4042]
MLLVVFTVAMITTTDLPYVLGATVRSGPDQIVRPAHLLASAALFMVILYETARIPVETHTGTIEFGMIETGRAFEYSGQTWPCCTGDRRPNSSCCTSFC